MATPQTATAFARTSPAAMTLPYEPSALNRLIAAIRSLPGGGWWVYPLTLLGLVAYLQLALWLTGSRPLGSLSLEGLQPMLYGPWAFASTHILIRVAGSSLSDFQPASGLTDAEYTLRRYELLTMPAGRLWLPLAIGTVFALGSLLSASPEALAPYGTTKLTALIVLGPADVFGYGMTLVVAYQTIRQLRLVDRLHREATAIDPFDTGPIYAFSRLTVLVGTGFVFTAYYSLVANAAYQAGNVLSIVIIVGAVILGVACFVVPLWGIHGRLVAAKAALVRGANMRAKALEAELYQRVDGFHLAGVKDITDALAGIRATREQIDTLPTWPWPPAVLRGFISAIVLPVVVFLVTRYAGELVR